MSTHGFDWLIGVGICLFSLGPYLYVENWKKIGVTVTALGVVHLTL
jgi:hypothetical protein